MTGSQDETRWEEIRVTGDQLVATLKDLVREGNIRRIAIKNEEGHTYLEIPLTVGVVGALLMPVLAAVGALAAVASGLTIAVEKVVPPGGTPSTGTSGTGQPASETPSDPSGDDG